MSLRHQDLVDRILKKLLLLLLLLFIYLFITCNWLDTQWQQSLHVTLARTMKILL